MIQERVVSDKECGKMGVDGGGSGSSQKRSVLRDWLGFTGSIQRRQIALHRLGVRVLWPQRLLPDRQGPRIQGPSPGQLAQILQQPTQIV